jgi:hypothetical protein
MALFTASVTGFWDDAATWGGGGVPADGDHVEITAGVTVTVRDARTIGTSPASADTSVWAIDLKTSAAGGAAGDSYLVLTSAAVLTVRGPVRVQNTSNRTANLTAIDINGGRWIWDGSAASGGVATYRLQLGSATFNYRRLVMRNAARMESVAGAGHGYVNTGGSGCNVDITGYCEFLRVGDATNSAIFNANNNNANSRWVIEDAWFDGGGRLGGNATAAGPGGTYALRRVTTTNTLAASSFSAAASSSATFVIDGCVFDKQLAPAQGQGFYVTNTTMLGGYNAVASSYAQWDDNLVVLTGTGAVGTPTGTSPAATNRREVRFVAAAGEVNTKIFALTASFTTALYEDPIIEPLGTAGSDGEYVATNNGADGTVTTLRGAIFLPYKDGGGLRSVEFNSNRTSRVDMEHCSVAAYQDSVGIGHSGHDVVASAGIERARVKSNLFVNFTASTISNKVGWISNDVVDAVLGAQCVCNAWWGVAGAGALAAGRHGQGYDQALTSAVGADAPGAGDVSADPWGGAKPAGPQVRLATVAAAAGYVGTAAAREAAWFAALNVRHLTASYPSGPHADYNAAVTHAAYRTAVRADWAPTNAAFQAAHDAGAPTSNALGWIGAVEGTAAPSTGAARARRRRRALAAAA